MKYLSIVILSLFTISCSQNTTPQKASINTQPGIMGGVIVEKNDAISKSVVGIVDMRDGASCTGTLIAENVLITAAHCVKDINPRTLTIVFHMDIEWIMSAKEPDIIQEYTRRVTSAVYHELYSDSMEEEDTATHYAGSYDVALIKFKGTLPEGYSPAKILADDGDIKVKDMVHVAGYGVHEIDLDYVDPDLLPNLDKLLDEGRMVCDDNYTQCAYVEYYTDGKFRKAQAPIMGFTENEFMLDEAAQGTCSGDSGGPAFIEKDGEFYLYGVTSRGSALCDKYGLYGNVSFLQDWITKTLPKLN